LTWDLTWCEIQCLVLTFIYTFNAKDLTKNLIVLLFNLTPRMMYESLLKLLKLTLFSFCKVNFDNFGQFSIFEFRTCVPTSFPRFRATPLYTYHLYRWQYSTRTTPSDHAQWPRPVTTPSDHAQWPRPVTTPSDHAQWPRPFGGSVFCATVQKDQGKLTFLKRIFASFRVLSFHIRKYNKKVAFCGACTLKPGQTVLQKRRLNDQG
jgi:hypothetical protein